eukprot:GFYU01010559.1.p1 GENE.GFYU01010559.1~~GFYU01010559.1.p1  ORF type:complete len:239 (-),score=71.05 GFYU01010559.1:54-770(-)
MNLKLSILALVALFACASAYNGTPIFEDSDLVLEAETTTVSETQPQHMVGYPNEVLPHSNVTNLAIVNNPNYGLHVFALGKDRKIYHRWQNKTDANPIGFSDWHMLTPGNLTWDCDPAAGINEDGRIEVFFRNTVDLDLWQIRQTDATNPLSWSNMRGPACICNYPPCPECYNVPYDKFWSMQPLFPTSDTTVVKDPVDGHLQVLYRGFDGALYIVEQVKAGDPTKYHGAKRFEAIIE